MQTRKRARAIAQQQAAGKEEKKTVNSLQKILPVSDHIVPFLRLRDIGNLARAAKFTRDLMNQPSTWMVLYRLRYGKPCHPGDYQARCKLEVLVGDLKYTVLERSRTDKLAEINAVLNKHKTKSWTHYYLAQCNKDEKQVQHALDAVRAGDRRALSLLADIMLEANRPIKAADLDEFLKILSNADNFMEEIEIERYMCLIFCIKASLAAKLEDKLAFKEKAFTLFFKSLTPETTQIREFISFGLYFLRALKIEFSQVSGFNLSNRFLLNAPNLMEAFVADPSVYCDLSRLDPLLRQKFVEWLREAIRNDNTAAMLCYAKFEMTYDPGNQKEKALLIKASELGDARAANRLSMLGRDVVTEEELKYHLKKGALKGVSMCDARFAKLSAAEKEEYSGCIFNLLTKKDWKKTPEFIWFFIIDFLRTEPAGIHSECTYRKYYLSILQELMQYKQKIDVIPLFVRCALTFLYAMRKPAEYAEAREQYAIAIAGKSDIFNQFLKVAKNLNINVTQFEAVVRDFEKELAQAQTPHRHSKRLGTR